MADLDIFCLNVYVGTVKLQFIKSVVNYAPFRNGKEESSRCYFQVGLEKNRFIRARLGSGVSFCARSTGSNTKPRKFTRAGLKEPLKHSK